MSIGTCSFDEPIDELESWDGSEELGRSCESRLTAIFRCRICPMEWLRHGQNRHAIGVAIGDQILDLQACARQGLFVSTSEHDVVKRAEANL